VEVIRHEAPRLQHPLALAGDASEQRQEDEAVVSRQEDVTTVVSTRRDVEVPRCLIAQLAWH
jgi:hypothetical protein